MLQSSGEWSGEAPFCARVNCTENYKVPQGGFVAEDAGHKYQDQIEVDTIIFHYLSRIV